MSINNLLSLSGKTALISGASSGLGEHFAQVMAQAGAQVIVAARRVDKLADLVEKIRAAGGNAEAL
ncbi:MAG: SDR family NAD(P)-dependent oxidoreductase, partial [Spongiibacteraceae bacterium]|nr:SDR family NAD(P)-dependent oxidoreductase [Spongiibacteraceae bacterium]